MTTLKYVGRPADADASLAYKKVVDDMWTAIKVDQPYINTTTATHTVDMVTQSYIDSQDAMRAATSAVDAADAGYLGAYLRGIANGVASLDGTGTVPSGQLPTLVTDRVATVVNGTVTPGFVSRIVTTTNIREFVAATLTIADPGYPYVVLPFAMVQGGAVSGSPPATHTVGTGNYGHIHVISPAPTNEMVARCVTTGQYGLNFFQALPYASQSATPLTVVPRTGSLTLDLCLSLWSGTTYTFNSTGLIYYVIVFPAV